MPARVLVVDDDVQMRRAITRVLRSLQVLAVETASDALRSLGEAPFDVILTDYGIAPIDGVSLLQQVASSYPDVRRYLMSGFEPSRFDAHVESGLVRRVFPKPLDLDQLRSELGLERTT